MICVPLALHALSALPSKLRPMFSLLRPVTLPLVAAHAVVVMAGSSVSTISMASANDRKRLKTCFIFFVFLLFFGFSLVVYSKYSSPVPE